MARLCENCQREDRTARQRRRRFLCNVCNRADIEYRRHWFVRSLEYVVSKPKPIRPRDPLPGQRSLFEYPNRWGASKVELSMTGDTLETCADRYSCANVYAMQPGSVAQLRYAARSFSRHLGHVATLSDLTPAAFNGWVDNLARCLAPATARTQRGSVLTLWRWAYDCSLVDAPPLRVRRLRAVRHCPEAWTMAEVNALIAATRTLRGSFRGGDLRRSLWWQSLVCTAYDTAHRLGDLLRLRWSDLDRMRLVQHKTGVTAAVRVRPATLAVLDQWRADRSAAASDLLWPLWGRRESFYRAFARLVLAANVRPGTFRWLRRTAVTQLERVAPGQGTRLAGHLHRSTTEAWYIDRLQLDPPPLPPLSPSA